MYISVYAQTQTANAAQDTDSDTNMTRIARIPVHTGGSRDTTVQVFHAAGDCLRFRLFAGAGSTSPVASARLGCAASDSALK